MVLGFKKTTSIDISMNGPELKSTMFDQKLKWIDNIAYVKLKINQELDIIIKKAKYFLFKKCLENLYYSFI